jgi:large subunit ribosomal protein L22
MIHAEVQAQRKHVGIPVQKVRLVLNQVRGMRAEDALATLSYLPQAAAKEVYKTINSALANAEQNEGVAREDMWISEIYADEGPTRKWRRFGARGRFKPILKRSAHITVVLQERT